MSLCGKMEADIEMKAPAEKVFEFYTCLAYQMSKSSPEMLHSVDLQEGRWGQKGSVLCWNYLIGNIVRNLRLLFIYLVQSWLLVRVCSIGQFY